MTRISKTRIKVCGITNLTDARCASEAGADFLGFIFYPKSPRFVPPGQVAAITQAIRGEFGAAAPRCVGVFVNEPLSQVQAVLDAAGLDLAQLHGSEQPNEMRRLSSRAFKAIRPQSPDDALAAVAAYGDVFASDETLPQLLIDAYHPKRLGGTGLRADLASARSVVHLCRLLLAGGLTPETVGSAIEAVQPWGVDVSSGVEASAGIKDQARVHAFVKAARGGL